MMWPLLVVVALLAQGGQASCPYGPSTQLADSDGWLEGQAVMRGQWAYYELNLGAASQALRVEVETSRRESLVSVHLWPATCFNSTQPAAVPEPRLEESQQAMWTDGVDSVNVDGHFTVGVNAPHLIQPGLWYVGVAGSMQLAADQNETFRIRLQLGSSACKVPTATDLLVCGRYVDFPVLNVQLQGRDGPPPGLSTDSSECYAEAVKLWCFERFYRCDNNTGVGIKPCRTLCSPLQGEKCVEDLAGNEQLNNAVCFSDPPPGFNTNFGSDVCWPKYPRVDPPCLRTFFACETPECYLAARPLTCSSSKIAIAVRGAAHGKSGGRLSPLLALCSALLALFMLV